ncbi:MAG: energy-coupling factor transporter transmembrane protein EcfT [Acidimicrobiia bacterium]|nr:energy-coupling factor transporter transmembrane protein EcfT [Acidimicrobiia bacterium]
MRNRLNLLRYVDGDSTIHRLNPRAKITALVALLAGFSFDASWTAVMLIWLILVGGALLARLPRGVVPRPPRILLITMAITCGLGLIAGGDPYGLGGVILQVRLFGFAIGLFGLSMLLGWTTPTADLPVAASWLLTPLRRVRVPVDDVAAGLTLAVRALPLVAEEFTTVITMNRFRTKQHKDLVVRGMDLAATATVATVRRSIEIGEAVEARGGMPTAAQIAATPSCPNRWGLGELLLGTTVAAMLATVFLS